MGKNKLVWEQKKAFVIEELMCKGYCGISVVGQGAFAVVLRVWDAKLNCYWACKVSAISQMAKNEAEMLRNIQHPVFPKYKECWESQGCFFLLMEYIFGNNIRELCNKRIQFTQRQAVHIALELAQGISFMHERDLPILFRDIKPENVMIRQDGRVKLVDMGCAVLQNEKQCVAGSIGYSAPEQFCGRVNAGAESDVYALGRLLLFMLTGVESNVGHGKWKFAGQKRKISRGLKCLVGQATRQECQKRIPDMRIFIKQLSIYEKKCLFNRGCKNIKNILFSEEIVDFYYMQNIRRGIDN